MTDVDRVLDALLHDFRSPLAAATGYLRLIGEKRIPPGLEQDRAIAQTQAALRNLSALCARAETWRMTPTARASFEPLPRACEELVRALGEHSVPVECDEFPATAIIGLASDWPDVCPTLTAMLALVARPHANVPSGVVHIRHTSTCVRISVRMPEGPDSIARSPFDPWAYAGLVVALGCLTVERSGGSWQADVGDAVVRVEFPLAL